MARKTEGVNLLVLDVLATLKTPYGKDIIEDVCLAIEGNPQWLHRYEQLTAELNVHEVNKAIGRHTKANTGLNTVRVVQAERAKIIKWYSKLR